MKHMTIGKLVGAWSALQRTLDRHRSLLASLGPDAAGSRYPVLLKIVCPAIAFSAAGFALMYTVARSWSLHGRRLQEFVEAPLDATGELPEDGPPELQRLSRCHETTGPSGSEQVMERANRELSRRETILAAMAEGVLAVDQNLKVIFCNDAFAQAFGTRDASRCGKNILRGCARTRSREHARAVVQSGSSEKDRFRIAQRGRPLV